MAVSTKYLKQKIVLKVNILSIDRFDAYWSGQVTFYSSPLIIVWFWPVWFSKILSKLVVKMVIRNKFKDIIFLRFT